VKVAYLSPLPPERSGVADYSALLLPALRQHVEVEVVSRRSLRRAAEAEVSLYHVGNDAVVHGWIVEELQRRPGVVVLHDTVLHHLVVGMTLAQGREEAYLEAVERDGGGDARSAAEAALAGLAPPLWEKQLPQLPLLASVLAHATAVIVHSRHAEHQVRAAGFEGPVHRVPMPAWPAPPNRPAELPRDSPFVVVSLGKLNAAKRVPQLLQAFARLRARVPGSLLVLGEVDRRLNLDARLEALSLERGADLLEVGRTSEDDLWSWLARADAVVSLRWPTMGEASGIAVRALSLGRPLVVSDVGWFSELPDAVAAKVAVDEWEVDLLTAVLELLATDESLRERMGAAAHRHAEQEQSLGRAAALYAEVLEQAVEISPRESVRA
jgi:glycosyltransferase involved in cell wall biosynthesis